MNQIRIPEDDESVYLRQDLVIREIEEEAKAHDDMGFRFEATAIRKVIARIQRLGHAV